MTIRKNSYATKAPKSTHGGQARFVAICGAVIVMLTVPIRAFSAEPFNFPPSDFNILDAGTGKLIGNGHYVVDRLGNQFVLHGENHYLTGEYDLEEDKLSAIEINNPSTPALLSFRHDFYNAAGTLVVAGRLDTETSLGVCGKVENGTMNLKSAQLKFPADTYAGASVLLPIQDFVRRDSSGPLNLHVFNCAPSPKLIAVVVKRGVRKLSWADYPGELEKVDIKPNFGFFTVIVTPFIPKLAAWFDPSHDSLLVGAQLERYYKGAKIILVRARLADATSAANRSPLPP